MKLCIMLTRNLKLYDMKALAEALGGSLLKRREGGVALEQVGPGTSFRDVRFCGCGHSAVAQIQAFYTADGKTYRYSDDTMWATVECHQPHLRRLWVLLTPRGSGCGPAAPENARIILNTVARVFDARECAIYNRHVIDEGPNHPLPSDSDEACNDFFGVNYRRALQVYTVASAQFPTVEQERLLRCWGCAAHRPAWEFNYPDPLGLGPMEAAVVHVATGRMRLCIACEDKAVYAPERSKPQRTLFSNTHKRNPDAIDRPYWVAEVQERIDPGNLEEDLDDMKQINARYHGPTYHHVGYASHRYDSFKQLVHRYNKAFPDLPPMELTGPDRGVSSCHPDTNMRFVARRLFGNMHTALAPHF